MPARLLPGDDDEVEVPLGRPGRSWQSHASDEDILFVRSRDNETQVDITTQDACVQTSTWQSYSLVALDSELVFRLSTGVSA